MGYRWDYQANPLTGLMPQRKYYLVMVSESPMTIYEYSRLVGVFYSRIKSTRKALFVKSDQPHERIYFDQFSTARRAIIEIAKIPVANVPVGQYVLQVRVTGTDEPIVAMSYYVKKEIEYVGS